MKLTRAEWFNTATMILKKVALPDFAYSAVSVIGDNDTILIYMSADDKLDWPDMMYNNSRFATFQYNDSQLSLYQKADGSPSFESIEITKFTDFCKPLLDYYKKLSK
jgi:hypothetical protein